MFNKPPRDYTTTGAILFVPGDMKRVRLESGLVRLLAIRSIGEEMVQLSGVVNRADKSAF